MSEIVVHQNNGGALALPSTWGYMGPSIDSAAKLAKVLVGTGLAPSGMSAGQAFYILLAGAELGLRGPVEALRHVVVIKGKPSISAELMRSMMLQGGCKLSWIKADDKGATLKITRPDGSTGTFSFGEEDARRAGLLSSDTYKKYPASMYQARVTSLAGRAFCPDMLRGASYTPEELGARTAVNGEGEIVHETTTESDDPEPATEGDTSHAFESAGLTDSERRLAQTIADRHGAAVVEMVERVPEDPPASAAQVKALAILATKKLGGITRDGRLAMYAEIIGREIQSSNDLTQREWRQVVDALNAMDPLPPKGDGTPTSEAKTGAGNGKASGTAKPEPAPGAPTAEDVEQVNKELWGNEPDPAWKTLTVEQKAVRDSIVRLAASTAWVNTETRQVFAPQAIRDAFTVDPGEWVEPERLATRPNPRGILAIYHEEVEAARVKVPF